ncbi:hypothetical protein K438DRAFT_1899346, partial [Mycena galopus ATCC 62051]
MPPSLSASTLCCRYRSCSPAFLLCCCSVPHNPRCRTADLIIFDELQKPSHTVVHLPLSADMCTASRFPPDLCALHDPFIIPSIFTIEEVVIHLHCPSIHPVDSGFNSMLFTSPCDYIPIRIMMLHQPPTIAPCHPLGHGHLPLLVDSFLGCTGSTQLSLASAHTPILGDPEFLWQLWDCRIRWELIALCSIYVHTPPPRCALGFHSPNELKQSWSLVIPG